jgi:2-hydroxychromene-2-carboxylate isomerase
MSKTVTFYFDIVSPTSYLASTQLPAIAERAGATIDWRPFLLGGVFRTTGNRPPAELAPKGVYMYRDLQRFARRYGVEIEMSPYFPLNTLTTMRVVTGVQLRHPDSFLALVKAAYRAAWVEQRNVGEDAVIGEILTSVGLDPSSVLPLAAEQAIKDKLRAETEGAVARGAFGAPTFFVGDEMFFGQDRLDFVREALEAA